MRLTKKQKTDLETIRYFIPSQLKDVPITEKGTLMFFDLSERGKYRELVEVASFTSKDPDELALWALYQGKKWRGINIHELFEPGVLDGSMPYIVILGGYPGDTSTPRAIVDFMKKEMFQGTHAWMIEEVYQEVLASK